MGPSFVPPGLAWPVLDDDLERFVVTQHSTAAPKPVPYVCDRTVEEGQAEGNKGEKGKCGA